MPLCPARPASARRYPRATPPVSAALSASPLAFHAIASTPPHQLGGRIRLCPAASAAFATSRRSPTVSASFRAAATTASFCCFLGVVIRLCPVPLGRGGRGDEVSPCPCQQLFPLQAQARSAPFLREPARIPSHVGVKLCQRRVRLTLPPAGTKYFSSTTRGAFNVLHLSAESAASAVSPCTSSPRRGRRLHLRPALRPPCRAQSCADQHGRKELRHTLQRAAPVCRSSSGLLAQRPVTFSLICNVVYSFNPLARFPAPDISARTGRSAPPGPASQAGHHGQAQLSAAIWGRYSESGHRAFVLRKVIGCSMAFHASRKPSTAAERMPGTPAARRYGKKMRSGPHRRWTRPPTARWARHRTPLP